MTTTYNGTNITLEYDAATATWGFKNTAQDFIDTNTFSTADPSFEYAPVPPAEDTEPEPDPCPPGYVYDESLKQCVPDPNYQNPFVREQPQGGSDDNFSDTNKIPSNETKENWIKNANTIIPPGEEGAGKTGYENYIDNLKERGFTKVVDGKLVFKTDSLGSKIGSAMLSRFGMGDEPEAKTNKIIKDLQRMGGVNAEITMNDDGEIEYISELELANSPGTFATYNYDGTDLTGGNYTGFTTPATNILGVQTFKTWEDYVAAIMQPFTSTSSQIKNTTKKVSAGERMDMEMAVKEKERIELEKAQEEKRIAEEKRKQEEIKTQEAIAQNQYNQQDFSERDSSKESGGSYGGGEEDRPVIKPKKPSGGTTLGSSVHGTGSYNPGGSNTSSSSSVPSGNTPGFSGNPFIDR